MILLAQTAVQETPDSLLFILRSLGVSGPVLGILAIVAITVRGVVKWAMPHLEKMGAAWAARQDTMAACQKNLTESTIDIQRKNQMLLQTIHDKLPLVCQAKECPQRDQ